MRRKGRAGPVEQPIGSTLDKEHATGVPRKVIDRFNAAAVRMVDEAHPSSILDVACGDGWLTSLVADRVQPVTCVGVDRDSDALRARWDGRPQANLRFEVADLYALPFRNAQFEMVTLFEALEHCDDVDAALSECLRVCRTWLVVSVPWEPFWRLANVARGEYVRDWGNTPGHVNHWGRRGFTELLRGYGRLDHVETCAPWTLARLARD